MIAAVVVAAVALFLIKPWAPRIVVAEAGPTGERITDQGMVANWYPAADPGSPAVLVLGGSGGGIAPYVHRQATALQSAGFSALALSYWGGPGQPSNMELLPLEAFANALEWLGDQPEVDPERLGVMGTSKGAEAALLLATRHAEIAAVIAYVPSSVVWAGLDLAAPWRMAGISSTWSEAGQPVPWLPYDQSRLGPDTYPLFEASLQHLPSHSEAAIPIEQSDAPMLLICSGQDTIWPSCPMSQQLIERAAGQDRQAPTELLTQPDAGHLAVGPPVDDPEAAEQHAAAGGTVEDNQAAMAENWPKVMAFLTEILGNS